MIDRVQLISSLRRSLRTAPVVALLGPRQCGKTTLARTLAGPAAHFLDLEDPRDLALLAEPMTFLRPLRGLIVIDEVQRRPDLFPVLRVLADRTPRPARFLLLGSASPELLRQSSETLAGRIAFHEMGGFDLGEVGDRGAETLWRRGGFPRAYLARSESHSAAWRRDFIATFVERDLPQLGFQLPAAVMRRFWAMLAHYHGQLWNGAELARSLSISEVTVKRYLDVFTGALMIRQLPPWFENLRKRQVKSPKIYLRDSGVLHTLLDIETAQQLHHHPKSGASWEGFALENFLRLVAPRQAYFWATHEGAELDLLFMAQGKRWGVEFKRTDSPRSTKSVEIAKRDLGLNEVFVVHPGVGTHAIGKQVMAIGMDSLPAFLKKRRFINPSVHLG